MRGRFGVAKSRPTAETGLAQGVDAGRKFRMTADQVLNHVLPALRVSTARDHQGRTPRTTSRLGRDWHSTASRRRLSRSEYVSWSTQGGHALTGSPAKEEDDATRWWQAYCLAENDDVDELRHRADAGDDHARRQLASWLGDRGRAQEALTLIRPLADTDDDLADLWLARWLAECDEAGELRQRAHAGDDHALLELADWLKWQHQLDELRELIGAEDGQVWQRLAPWRSVQGDLDVLRVLADMGDDDARGRLARWLARRGDVDELRWRAESEDEHARRQLADPPAG
jgi:hypothetical protein